MSADKCAECEAHGITEAPVYDDSHPYASAKGGQPYCGVCGLEPGEHPLTFILTITLGNEAMQTVRDVLNSVQDAFVRTHKNYNDVLASDDSGAVVDLNGNTVGSWGVN